jgi:L-iditol 2-dehydrogenase
MPELMKAAVLHKVKELRIEEVPRPELTADSDVLVKMAAVGVCGSDCHFYEEGRIATYVVEKPLILGHECAGTVVAVGKAVRHLKAGDRVCLEPGIACLQCQTCKSGRYNLCEREVSFMGTPPTNGAFCEYVVWPAHLAFKLPEALSLEEGALIEPLAVAVQAANRSGLRPGSSVAVLGAGPIGLMCLQAASAYGAGPIYATDVIPYRLEFARSLGARVFNARETDPVEAIRKLTGRGADVVYETAGTVGTIGQAMRLVRPGGVVTLIGWPQEQEFVAPMVDIIAREYDVRGVFRYCNAYPTALSLAASGKVGLKPFLGKEFPLARTREALEFASGQKQKAIKVQVKV